MFNQDPNAIKMKIITINIADQYLDSIQVFIELGLVDSRSEFVRKALRHFLEKEPERTKEQKPESLRKILKRTKEVELK